MNDDVDILPPNSVWDNVSTLISHIIPISPSTTMSAAFHDSEGCRTFPSCILLSHRYAISAAIDNAALYGARALAEGLGLDYSLVDSHVARVHSSGILDYHTHTLVGMYGFDPTFASRDASIPPPTYMVIPSNPIHSLTFNPFLEVVEATQFTLILLSLSLSHTLHHHNCLSLLIL
jgi:hypothetical protein